jgi:hypothetical protein
VLDTASRGPARSLLPLPAGRNIPKGSLFCPGTVASHRTVGRRTGGRGQSAPNYTTILVRVLTWTGLLRFRVGELLFRMTVTNSKCTILY